MPLPELLADCMGASAASKRVQAAYMELLQRLGPEFAILRELPLEDVERAAGRAVAEALRRLRAGQVIRRAGYDGEYGVITRFEPHELEIFGGQTTLMDMAGLAQPVRRPAEALRRQEKVEKAPPAPQMAEQLNERQRQAVETTDAAVAVIAGPGTGKTKTLVARIAYLVETLGAEPSGITAVTFTNQAAREMTERLEARLGKKAARALHVGTFHALSLGWIEKKPLIGQAQAIKLLRELLQQHGESMSAAEAQRRISLVKNGGAAELPEGLREAYDEALAQEGVRDLDDVLLEALKADVQGKRPFTHLLVDEFQDINAVQRELVRHWSAAGKTLFVIGDADQSIYGFRGANAACFDELKAVRPDLQVLRLEENYRSAPAVLRSALSVIGHNPGGTRVLHANRPEGAPVRVMTAPDAFSEGVWIAKEIGRMVGGVGMLEAQTQGTDAARSFGEIAVLCRTRKAAGEHRGVPGA